MRKVIPVLFLLSACNSDPVFIERTDLEFQSLIVKNDQTDPSKNHNRQEINPNQAMVVTVDHLIDGTGYESRQVIVSLRHQIASGSLPAFDLDFGNLYLNTIKISRFMNRVILPDSIDFGGSSDTIDYVNYYQSIVTDRQSQFLSTRMQVLSTGSDRVHSANVEIDFPEPAKITNLVAESVIDAGKNLEIRLNQYADPGFSGVYLYPANYGYADSSVIGYPSWDSLFVKVSPTTRTNIITIPAGVLQQLVRHYDESVFVQGNRFIICLYGFQSQSTSGITWEAKSGEIYRTPVFVVSNFSLPVRLELNN